MKSEVKAALQTIIDHVKDRPADAPDMVDKILTEAYAGVDEDAPDDSDEPDTDEGDSDEDGHVEEPAERSAPPPTEVYILSIGDMVMTNAPIRPGEQSQVFGALKLALKPARLVLTDRHALARTVTDNALTRSSVDPDGTVENDIKNLLSLAADALMETPDGVAKFVLDTESEIQAAMMLELRGKGQVVRVNTTPKRAVKGRHATEADIASGNPLFENVAIGTLVDDGTVGEEDVPGAPKTVETTWQVSRVTME